MTETFLPGTIFAGYRIERLLGKGGMGAVYLARHPRLPRWDALKVLSAQQAVDAVFRARFVREADLAAQLDHPNIVAVHDRGVDQGRLWIAMQFVDGPDTGALLRRAPGGLPPHRVADIVGAVARGLDAAHRAGVLHRDVKPGNILLESRENEPDRVFVTDFGIARAQAESTSPTEPGTVLATLAYAAPEQLTGGAVDHRADVYALGCTLYELLTGARPFPRPSAAETVRAHLRDAPPRPSAVRPALPQGVDEVVARALAKDPDHRYPSCGELAAAVATAVGTKQQPAPVGGSVTSRSRIRFALATAVGVGAVVLGIGTVLALTGNLGGESSALPTSAARSSTAAAPTTAVGDRTDWGSYQTVIRQFPRLLPATPNAVGHGGIRCHPVDLGGNPVELNSQLGELARLQCDGDRNPVERLVVNCNTDRQPNPVAPFTDMTVRGDESWQRIAGTGRVIWGDLTGVDGRPTGTVLVQFDPPIRDFCHILVRGGASGQDLYDRWWRDAPL
ncbi:serine/threonine-protein kinase [Nocardia sp. CY41]|uniref:serine/threonine-protein kinase n=1 Tax=Nocardia sp. CY41 TaxID=2608686 RepID=UPI0013595FEB|nr:serine/threonine-protein kinase [Nocardia sp. CY41]